MSPWMKLLLTNARSHRASIKAKYPEARFIGLAIEDDPFFDTRTIRATFRVNAANYKPVIGIEDQSPVC